MASSINAMLKAALVLAALGEFVVAEQWNAEKHYRHLGNLRAERTPRTSRRLEARQSSSTTQPGQPQHTIPSSLLGAFEPVGSSGVSAQQMFLGTDNLVYILDKVEDNAMTINGHAAWATVYDLTQNTATPLDVVTNTFCAGGGLLGDGRWLNLGGNQAVVPGGWTFNSSSPSNVYTDTDGGFAARTITPGTDAQWNDDHSLDLTVQRWYPTLETMPDGRILVFGGDHTGGFVNYEGNSEPTWEFWPRYDGEARVNSTILQNTLPANLFPIANLLPSGQVILNINQNAAILDFEQGELPLPAVPHAVRTYPASAATVMFPLTVESGWNATVMYCGGSDISKEQWLDGGYIFISVPASASCIKISPATESDFEEEDSLPEGRVMGNAILLPDSTILVLNGANTGVAGYAFNNSFQQGWSRDDSFADNPVYSPVIYDPNRPAGSRWSRDGLKASSIPRMYHSSATLLPDGSVLVAGSNPHPDLDLTAVYPTEYRVERFYPQYYSQPRPQPSGIPTTITYGGQYFDLQLSSTDLSGNVGNLNAVRIWLIKTGFSTHGINFGQRMVELDHTFTANSDGSATLHVSQAPPSASIIPPGPAWFYVVINGIPSVGVQVMVGSGSIGTQSILSVEALPESSNVTATPDQSRSAHSGATASIPQSRLLSSLSLLALMFGGLVLLA